MTNQQVRYNDFVKYSKKQNGTDDYITADIISQEVSDKARETEENASNHVVETTNCDFNEAR